MMDSNLKQELLNTKSLKEFQTICLKHKLKMNDLDVKVLKYYASLGHGVIVLTLFNMSQH